jgi:hypothetical protein
LTISSGAQGANPKVTLTVRVLPDGEPITLIGRDAWALERLIEAGDVGCTPIDTPGPRWSGYVHKCRKAGIGIETIHETHGGPFAGRHARYKLASEVLILDDMGGAA